MGRGDAPAPPQGRASRQRLHAHAPLGPPRRAAGTVVVAAARIRHRATIPSVTARSGAGMVVENQNGHSSFTRFIY